MAVLKSLNEFPPRLETFLKTNLGGTALRTMEALSIEKAAKGQLLADTSKVEVFVVENGVPKRRKSLKEINPAKLPLPNYAIQMTGPRLADLLPALRYALRRFRAVAPISSGRKKNHPFSYSRSIEVWGKGGIVNSVDQLDDDFITPDSTFTIVNVAPHASFLERDSGDVLMKRVALDTLSKFGPGVFVAFEYENSDSFGYTYRPDQGGPTPETARKTGRTSPVVYALPTITLGLAGIGGKASFIANAKRRRSRRPTSRRR